ncbi:ExeM/NucH family extracellular endonuclease [Burkholderia perseverans]|uniref:ExeM/NucH family extracellular endonuclease n=1 Tax=Burkholderia perseverans TaxID=2615214 RepID=UPI003CC7D90B
MNWTIARFVSICWLAMLPAFGAPVAVDAACGGAATPIAEVRGGPDSPANLRIVSIEAVVTADYGGAGGLGGFFVQQADAQRAFQPGVSEGLFVYAPRARATAGDRVRVTGAIERKYGQTQLTLAGPIAVCAHGRTVSPATLTLPVADAAAFAAVEGMLVRLPQTLTVSEVHELGRYGSILLSRGRLPVPTHLIDAADTAGVRAQAGANARNRLILDDGSSRQNPAVVPYPAPGLSAANPLRVGYTVRDVEGVMERRFGAWRLQPVPGAPAPAFDAAANPRVAAPARDARADLRVAAFNVLNYFNGDGRGAGFDAPDHRGAPTYAEFLRQEAKIVSAITALRADVVGLMEIANNGHGERSAVRRLATQLGDGWRVVEPGGERLGGDAIKVALLYDGRTVKPVGQPATLASDGLSRAPLAQTFRRSGGAHALTVVVNHLKSKRCRGATGADADRGDGQGCWNPARVRMARRLADWLDGDPTGAGHPGVLLIGDLNSYAKEAPIARLEARGYVNLVARFLGAGAYSYVFRGESGYLDHALASASLVPRVLAVHHWHINADEPAALQYAFAYKSDWQRTAFYAPDAYRSSDHDPVIVDLALDGSAAPDASSGAGAAPSGSPGA